MELTRSGRISIGRAIIRSLHNTIARLEALRERLQPPTEPDHDHLTLFRDFGPNPGALQGKIHVPAGLEKGAPLVVVLHGCTQTASGYDRGTGWSNAADEYGFAVLFPEQQRANNPNLCFNWFSPADATRGKGEASSIRQMVAAMEVRHGIDPSRVFVTGLSAGGAMAGVMLATYPDVFVGGAIIAGLPFGTARTVPEAFDRMRSHGGPGPDVLARLVRSASRHEGPWPKVSVWHGTADGTVDPANADAIVDQWRLVHGAPGAPSMVEAVNGSTHRVWSAPDGAEVVEEYLIPQMGHGTPLSTANAYGETAGPFMLEAGISSTRQTLRFWGIADDAQRPRLASPKPAELTPHPADAPSPEPEPQAWEADCGVQQTIEAALRAAGLLR